MRAGTGSTTGWGGSSGSTAASGETGGPGEACCVATQDAGCGDLLCEASVCDIDPFCCDVRWDAVCVLAAGQACDGCDPVGDAGGGMDPPGEDCCEVHEPPGCDDQDCEDAVCAVDGFCCDTTWDASCVDHAEDLCEELCGSGTTGMVDDDGGDDGLTWGWVSGASSSSSSSGGESSDTGDGGCPYAPGSFVEEEIEAGGHTRTYKLWIGEDAEFPETTVFAWHGWGQTAFDSGPRLEPDKHWKDGIVVAADGMKRTFEGLEGNLPGFQVKKGELGDRDLKLYDEIYKDLKDKKCLDPDEVYSTGFSNGGFMTHVVACNRGKQIAAAAPAGSHGPFEATCQDKVPMLISHGRNDELVSLDGAKGSWRAWIKKNGCTEGTAIPADDCATAPGCPDEEPVRFCNWDIAHTWPTGRAKRIAKFMRAYKKSD